MIAQKKKKKKITSQQEEAVNQNLSGSVSLAWPLRWKENSS